MGCGAEKARGYPQLQQRLDETSVMAMARGGAIRVTVDSNGVPTQLEPPNGLVKYPPASWPQRSWAACARRMPGCASRSRT